MRTFHRLLLTLLAAASFTSTARPAGDPARGYHWLTEKAYLPPDFDQETFDRLWESWPTPLQTQAESATPDERRRLAFSRYGLTERPDDPTKPLQYVVDSRGNWIMNCFACHAGKVAGRSIPGLPNSHFALETLTADVRRTKLRLQKPLSRMDVGSLVMPLGRTDGTTNAVMFGVALMAFRDADLNVYPNRPPPKMLHHDMDAPAWWHFKRKHHIYIDGFAEKGHRALMQFMLVHENGPEKFRRWEKEFQDVFAYLESLQPPKYPFAVDTDLAREGQDVFHDACAHCHGTYGKQAAYPGKVVPIDEVKTDRVRLDALLPEDRAGYGKSWFAHYGKHDTIDRPEGYVAPPLDGIWATAPYFHNGSVPTLWHVLHSSKRPAVWRRTEDGYDQHRVGLEIEEFERLPKSIRRTEDIRRYFNTGRLGKSAQGHTFPDELTEPQKQALLEYLKTL